MFFEIGTWKPDLISKKNPLGMSLILKKMEKIWDGGNKRPILFHFLGILRSSYQSK